jgi:hypothetical protein
MMGPICWDWPPCVEPSFGSFSFDFPLSPVFETKSDGVGAENRGFGEAIPFFFAVI